MTGPTGTTPEKWRQNDWNDWTNRRKGDKMAGPTGKMATIIWTDYYWTNYYRRNGDKMTGPAGPTGTTREWRRSSGPTGEMVTK